MTNIRICLCLLLCIFAAASGSAQQNKYDLSAPTDLKEVGVNKVLCMKNGNTMLFHFEPRKAVVVKVFDSTHKEIATQKHVCKFLDINYFDHTTFKGLFEVNGEAVLFAEQEHLSKRQLVRVRFDGTSGNIIDESICGESQGISHPIQFFVMKSKSSNGYAIVFGSDRAEFKDGEVHVSFYNGKHEEVKKVPIAIDRKAYDYMEVISADAQPNGSCITICLMTQVVNGTDHDNAFQSTAASVNHTLLTAFIPDSSITAKESITALTPNIFPYYSSFTYNPFAGTLNVLLFNYKEFEKKNGISISMTSLQSSLLFNLDQNDMSIRYNWFKNELANVYYKQQTDSTKLFDGIPVKTFTNSNGLFTVVSQTFTEKNELESSARPNAYDNYFSRIGITQCDDEGKEIWGIVLPLAQRFRSYNHFYRAHDLCKKWQEQDLFNDLPPQAYTRQFVSLNAYTFNRNYYIIYNDNNENFGNSITHPGDTVYSFENTNACYYKLNKKREVTKSYLFGEPAANEYKASFIEGADFDEQRGVYATLVQCRKDGQTTLCMAWCHLD